MTARTNERSEVVVDAVGRREFPAANDLAASAGRFAVEWPPYWFVAAAVAGAGQQLQWRR